MAGADAQAGFYYQNLIGALHLLDLIEVDTQSLHVTLENPSRAKHIDDIIVDTAWGSRFVQVKWADDPSASYTLASLVAVEDEGVSLWTKLARGYHHIRSNPGDKVVELFSTRRAGVNRQRAQGFEHSLQQFLTDFHEPYTRAADSALDAIPAYPAYANTLAALRKASEIPTDEEFAAFLKALRFSLGEDDRDAISARVRQRLSQLGIEQLQFGTLLDACVRWSIASVRVSAADVLRELGLTDRFAERLSHRFPVDEQLWVQTPDLFAALDEALTSLPGGFISVIGEPGAGKSTALTKYLRTNPEIRFGYYCFVPDEQTIGNERLQAASFVRSVCARLKDAFADFPFPTPYAEPSIDLLNTWLRALSLHKERVVFLIDGLDHVERKSNQSLLARPLTSVLDGQLPDNVLIILTSRYEAAIPPAITAHLQQDSRRCIRVRRFDEGQVAEFMRLRGVTMPDHVLRLVMAVSAGVPIYLEYLAEVLLPLSPRARETYLNGAPTLRDGKIDLFHEHMWQSWSADLDTCYILAILAVREAYTSVEMLQVLLKGLERPLALGAIRKVVQTLRYVLKVSGANAYAIHHASLAEFVGERTTHLRREISLAILAWYREQHTSDEAWRHELRHRMDLGQYRESLEVCDDDWVDRAWAHYRPLSEIQENLTLAWRASIEEDDLLGFVRIALLQQQVGLIAQNTEAETVDVATLLLDLGLPDVALNMVWDGERTVVPVAAFAAFAEHHAKRLGRCLPAAVVRDALAARRQCAHKDAAAIYRVCSLAIDPLELTSEILQLKWKSSSERKGGLPQQLSTDEENAQLNTVIFCDLLQYLAGRGDVDAVHAIGARADLPAPLHTAARFATVVALATAGAHDEAADAATQLPWNDLSVDFRGWAQTAFARKRIPFAAVPQHEVPRVATALHKDFRFNKELETAFIAFRVFMLNRPDAAAVLHSEAIALQGRVAEMVAASILLAEFWVNALRSPAPSQNWGALQAICDRLARPLPDPRAFERDDGQAYVYSTSVHLLYQQVWDCAKELLSPQAHLALDWLRSDDRCERLADATRALAVSLSELDSTEASAARHALLTRVEVVIRREEETATLTASLRDLARAWGICGFYDEGARIWRDIALVACGVYERKDYQFSAITLPLRLAHAKDPAGSRARLREQLQLAHQLDDTGSSKQVAISVEGLIELAAEWFPAFALRGLAAEDDFIFRERVLGNVLGKWALLEGLDQRLSLAILATLPRWEDMRSFNDHVGPAMEAFFQAMLDRHDFDIALETYRFARQVFLVEKASPRQVGRWASLWMQAGQPPEEVARDKTAFEMPEEQDAEFRFKQVEPASLATQRLRDLDSADLPRLEKTLDALTAGQRREERSRALIQGRSDWRQAFLAAVSVEAVAQELDPVLDNRLSNFEQSLLDILDEEPPAPDARIHALVEATCLDFSRIMKGQKPVSSFEITFDLASWLDRLRAPAGIGHAFAQELQQLAVGWIRECRYMTLDAWTEFARTRFTSDARAQLLLEVAKRIEVAKPDRAFALLHEARDSIANFLFEYTDLSQDIFAMALRLQPVQGRRFFLECFRQQYSKYPTMIVSKLAQLIACMDVGSTLDGVELYAVWMRHNRRLTAGLSLKAVDTTWLDGPDGDDIEGEIVRYLSELLRYPVVGVRLLSVEALVALVAARPDLIDKFEAQWRALPSVGVRSYVASILDSANSVRPGLVKRSAQWLVLAAGGEAHFDLRATVALAVCGQVGQVSAAAPAVDDCCAQARMLLEPPRIMRPLAPTLLEAPDKSVHLSPYASWMTQIFAQGCDDPAMLNREILRILRTTYPSAPTGREEDSVVHRHNNINSNFDHLEIAPAFDEACREAVNKAIVTLLDAHAIDAAHVMANADILRLRDPSDSLTKPSIRPSRIEWLAETTNDSEFLEFIDLDATIGAALRDHDGLTRVFEWTAQRQRGSRGAQSHRVCLVQLQLFGLRSYARTPSENELIRQSDALSNRFRNAYRTEISRRALPDVGSLVPLVAIAQRQFRGRDTGEVAALSAIWDTAASSDQAQTPHAYVDAVDAIAGRSLEWQEPFDQDRRRHEPRSSGAFLEVATERLVKLASDRSLKIFARIDVQRTTDKYKPEFDMQWYHRTVVVPVPTMA